MWPPCFQTYPAVAPDVVGDQRGPAKEEENHDKGEEQSRAHGEVNLWSKETQKDVQTGCNFMNSVCNTHTHTHTHAHIFSYTNCAHILSHTKCTHTQPHTKPVFTQVLLIVLPWNTRYILNTPLLPVHSL